jgi:hypothetical protein
MSDTKVSDLLTAGDRVDRLTGASLDDLRCLLGRLEDAQRIAGAVLREKTALSCRDAVEGEGRMSYTEAERMV